MQIFLTNPDFSQCAKDLDDKRLNKIIVESAQIASTALWINRCDIAETLYSQGEIYLPTHEHHLLCRWASENYNNFLFVIYYASSLCREYTYRFNKKHKTERIIGNLFCILFDEFINYEEKSLMPNCTTNHKHIENIYEAYKSELTLKWNNDKIVPKWTGRNKPKFYK
jgi:hypothetical protein